MTSASSNPIATLRAKNPLIQNISKIVTANDCANATLAIGASPIMADSLADMDETVAMADALVINIGTLHEESALAMLKAGRVANEHHVPVVLDPVGAGISRLRNRTLEDLLREVRFSIIKGNLSEINFLAGKAGKAKGVDVSEVDRGKTASAHLLRELAGRTGSVIVATGKVDTVSDAETTFMIHNGSARMGQVTGTGCMTASIMGAFCGAFPDQPLMSALWGIETMGIAGQHADKATRGLGTGSFHSALIDAISLMDDATLQEEGDHDEA